MERNHISRRAFLRLAGTGLAGTVIVACAPSAPAPAQQAGQSSEQAPQEAPAASGSKSFVLWGLQYDPHVERYKMLTDAFAKSTGITADIQPQAWPLETKLLAAITAGTVPDVVCVMGKQSIPLFLQKAVLQVDDVVYKTANVDVNKAFFPEAIQAYTWEGHYYGVPLETNSVGMATGTNLAYLDEAGDEAKALWPTNNQKDGFDSFEQLWSLAEMLQKKDSSGNVTRWGLSGQGWEQTHHWSLMRGLGMAFWDSTNQKFNLDTDESIAALDLYIGTPVSRGIETQLDQTHMDALFAGKVAIGMGNSAMPGEGEKLKLQVETVIVPPPAQGKTPLFVGEGGWGFEIPSRAKQQDVAIQFLQWMTTKDAMYIWSGIYGGAMPSSTAVVDTDIYQGEGIVKASKRRHLTTLPNTVFQGNDWGSNVTGIEDIYSKIRAGSVSTKEGAQQLQELMTQNYEQWKESMGA